MAKEYINAGTVHGPLGYTHVVAAQGAKTVYVSGQVALNQRNELVGRGDLRAQTHQTFENLLANLAAAGAKPSDVVKLTTYVVNYRDADRTLIREVRNEFFDPQRLPASTLIGVAALAVEGLLVEVEAIAVID